MWARSEVLMVETLPFRLVITGNLFPLCFSRKSTSQLLSDPLHLSWHKRTTTRTWFSVHSIYYMTLQLLQSHSIAFVLWYHIFFSGTWKPWPSHNTRMFFINLCALWKLLAHMGFMFWCPHFLPLCYLLSKIYSYKRHNQSFGFLITAVWLGILA